MNSIHENSFLVISAWTPFEIVLVGHICALIDEAVIVFIEFGLLMTVFGKTLKSKSRSAVDATSTDLSEEGVAIAAAFLDGPEFVVKFSSFSFETVKLHFT